MTDPNTRSVSESENPGMPAPEPASHRPRTNKDWWPNQLDLSVLHDNAAAIAERGCSPTANEIPTPGLAPLRPGTPDYAANPRLDRDNDGLACE